ncbi:MAG: bifunctional phosphoribosylaminoimidazolecarboxamide formyltransferase/IMP cyclohydrolase [Pseudomonadota bacterium]
MTAPSAPAKPDDPRAAPADPVARGRGPAGGLPPIRRALLSVSDKSGLEELARGLAGRGVELLSTGGTAAALRGMDLAVRDVAEVTGAPEMLDGRVKTLHPAIHGGLLARRDLPAHVAALEEAGFEPIDLLVVNLYPFEATIAAGAGFDEAIEQIDIGGPALIRGASKNHGSVAVLTDPADYPAFLAALERHGGATPEDLRRRLAAKAFARTAAYDAAIAGWFAEQLEAESADGDAAQAAPARLTLSLDRALAPSYGENPHQQAGFYLPAGGGRPGVASAITREGGVLQGKPLSYNNIADADAAFELVSELDRFGRPAVVIVKHANPCGAALDDSLERAYRRAHACDTVSAFGGIVALNRPLDTNTAEAILEIFTEVVIAPEVTDEARALFAAKKNIRLLAAGGLADPAAPGKRLVSVGGGVLAQSRDAKLLNLDELAVQTERAPTKSEREDMLFAWTVAKHVKSNAIVFAKDGATAGIGAGQMSRLDSTHIAARKAAAALDNPLAAKIDGSVVASDAFFPFPDGLLAAAEAGAAAAIQPGGSIRDDEVIAAADEVGMAMAFTGVRHFRH